MSISEEIRESIKFYTKSSDDSRLMKLLIDPIDYLAYIPKANKKHIEMNPYNKIWGQYLGCEQVFKDAVDFHNKKIIPFIKDEETFNIYMHHIKNILIQSYINYHDNSKKMPTKLYRSISKYEFDYLKTTRKINTLWSTTNSLKTAIGYTIEMSRLEWNPEEHFILEFSPREKIPFIDVDTDAETVFEPNEFILIPPFNISNLKLVKPGGMDWLGTYDWDNVPIYSVEFKAKKAKSNEKIEISDINRLYQEVSSGIYIYGDTIEKILNSNDTNKQFHSQNYRTWAKKLQELFNLQQIFMNNYFSSQTSIETLSDEIQKHKLLQK